MDFVSSLESQLFMAVIPTLSDDVANEVGIMLPGDSRGIPSRSRLLLWSCSYLMSKNAAIQFDAFPQSEQNQRISQSELPELDRTCTSASFRFIFR